MVTTPIERWVPIPGFSKYEISDRGRIMNVKSRRMLNPKSVNRNGMVITLLTDDGIKVSKQIHHLVAAAFMPGYEKHKIIRHKNKNKGDNRISNLHQKITPRTQYEQDLVLSRYPTFRFSKMPGHTCLREEINTCWPQ